VAVVTAPDKPSGRGMKMQATPVKKYALEAGLPVLQPARLKDEAFLETLRSFKPDIQIVVAFRMLPEIVWSLPAYGTFNLHASLLPQYRGAAPIQWAVMNGEKETGVTTFLLSHDIDTGDILFQEKITIGPNETAGSVHDRLMETGSKLVIKTVEALITGSVKPQPQSHVGLEPPFLKSAPKLTRENTRLIWTWEVKRLYNMIRGLSPAPGAWTMMYASSNRSLSSEEVDQEGLYVKVLQAGYEEAEHDLESGRILSDGKRYLKIAAQGGFIQLEILQLAGRKPLPVADFLHGFPSVTDFYFK
jgi:methionyl-tRNA formyltransferase